MSGRTRRRGELRPPRPAPTGARRFEAIVFDWDGTAVTDRDADATAVRERVEALCAAGVIVAVVSGTHVGNVDGQLRARPREPGKLFLCLNRGSEVFEVDRDGPRVVWRHEATADENHALDLAAKTTVLRLGQLGLDARVVSERLNRRKIDVIPLDEWSDPPKARIDELLEAVVARLRAHGLNGLPDAVAIALDAAREVGLANAKVTSDAKHVEIGLTDKADSGTWIFGLLGRLGIGAGLTLVAGDEFGSLGGVQGSDSLLLVPGTQRCTAISVGVEPEGVPAGVRHIGGGPRRFLRVLDDQLRLRRVRRVPSIDDDPEWSISIDSDPLLRRVHETLLTLASGVIGTRGTEEEHGRASNPLVVAGGVFDGEANPALLAGPRWTDVIVPHHHRTGGRRVLDLRTGTLWRDEPGALRSLRFASLADPGVVALRAEGAGIGSPGPLQAPASAATDVGPDWMRTSSVRGSIAAAAHEAVRGVGGLRIVERFAAYRCATGAIVDPADAVSGLGDAERLGFDVLLARHREAWASRWADAEISIGGDPVAQLAARFALFHLMASVPDKGEAAVGARGLSGSGYGGHVFWDADVFVLPFLAATHPPAARAMIQYRLARLDAARTAARLLRRDGACFPWESADDGRDVTPRSARNRVGKLVAIRTGDHEDHITADVGWAAAHYDDWTGEGLLDGPARSLLTETARYWRSRVRYDSSGRAHILGVIGPDEYHEPVDDNAYTNVMARWNLRTAAALVERDGVGGTPDDAVAWRAAADAIADGFDPATGIYAQFSGFSQLEPLIISTATHVPVAADMLLGQSRVEGAQVLKQPDVLMLHHLVPDEVAPGSLEPNLRYYGPRTSHGSSLSPAIHAAVLARAGEPDEALRYFRIACAIDLEDLTGTTAGGLHLATLGGIWQALAFGFAGIRPRGGALAIDPCLPASWTHLDMTVRFRGSRVRVHAAHDEVVVRADGPVRVAIAGRPARTVENARFVRRDDWEIEP